MNIEEITRDIIDEFGTSDPFELAERLNITIVCKPLGSVNGFYINSDGVKIVNVNNVLEHKRKKLTIAHELGHAILHPNMNTPFMREHTFFSINKFEIEANTFAAHLLIPENELREYQLERYTTQQIAGIYHLPEELVNLRIYGTMSL